MNKKIKDGIGERMKTNYENRYRVRLTRRTPAIIRLDGKAFHTLTKHFEKPFDFHFINSMNGTARVLCNEIQNAKCAYVQSDEISILLIDYDSLQTEAWFDYNLQKMVSVSAGLASANFLLFMRYFGLEYIDAPCFDSRTFNIPREEVCNYFIWRQKDWIRNSVHMYASSFYSHKQLNKKKQEDMHEMLHEKGKNWIDLDGKLKNGSFIRKSEDGVWFVYAAPDFTKNREEIERYI